MVLMLYDVINDLNRIPIANKGRSNITEELNSFLEIEVGLLQATPDEIIVDRRARMFLGSFSDAILDVRT